MLSLANVTSEDDVRAWETSMEEFDAGAEFAPRYTVEPKVDGVALRAMATHSSVYARAVTSCISGVCL